MVQCVAEKTLLPVSEVWLWLEHLQTVDTNRKRGATKAALARKKGESVEATHALEPETMFINVECVKQCFKKRLKRKSCGLGVNISLTLNTDGVAIFKSSKNSLWPVWLVINELPPTERYVHV